MRQTRPHFLRILLSFGHLHTMHLSLLATPRLVQLLAFGGMPRWRQAAASANQIASMRSEIAWLPGRDGRGCTAVLSDVLYFRNGGLTTEDKGKKQRTRFLIPWPVEYDRKYWRMLDFACARGARPPAHFT